MFLNVSFRIHRIGRIISQTARTNVHFLQPDLRYDSNNSVARHKSISGYKVKARPGSASLSGLVIKADFRHWDGRAEATEEKTLSAP